VPLHTTPHWPQLCGSLFVLTQAPSQHCLYGPHEASHAPPPLDPLELPVELLPPPLPEPLFDPLLDVLPDPPLVAPLDEEEAPLVLAPELVLPPPLDALLLPPLELALETLPLLDPPLPDASLAASVEASSPSAGPAVKASPQ
jgi:hypothetical protein